MNNKKNVFSLLQPFKFISFLAMLDTFIAILIIITLGLLSDFNNFNTGLDINDYWISFFMIFFKIISGYYFVIFAYLVLFREHLYNFYFFRLLLVVIACYFFGTGLVTMMGKSTNWVTTYKNAYEFSPPYIMYIGLLTSMLSVLTLKYVKNRYLKKD